jgi:hypothetical protein
MESSLGLAVECDSENLVLQLADYLFEKNFTSIANFQYVISTWQKWQIKCKLFGQII